MCHEPIRFVKFSQNDYNYNKYSLLLFYNTELIDDWLRTACKDYNYKHHRPFRFSWIKKSATSIKSMVESCRDGGWSDCSFSVPTIGMLNKDWGNGIAYRTPFAVSYLMLTFPKIILFKFNLDPVITRHRFDVHTTSITLKRRRADIKTTSCVLGDFIHLVF